MPLIVCFLFSIQCPELKAQAAKRFPADDPELYSSFCFFMDSFSTWLDTRAAAKPAGRTQLMQSAAKYIKVDASELAKVVTVCRTITSNHLQISNELKQYMDQRQVSHAKPDASALTQFEARRQAAIQHAIAQFQSSLSQSNWNGLRTHINGTHRQAISVGLNNRKSP